MPGRMEAHRHPAKRDRLAIFDRLDAAREPLAVAQPHEIDGLARRQHGAVACPRVVGVPVRDECPVDRAHRIDMKTAEPAAQAGRGGTQKLLGTHCSKICRGGANARPYEAFRGFERNVLEAGSIARHAFDAGAGDQR